jgi:hypothetical protein
MVETPTAGEAEAPMSQPDDEPSTAFPPAWALQQATEELYDSTDPELVARRAREIARERLDRDDERHDEYDDPDRGGEG